jgi:hypothetical protein
MSDLQMQDSGFRIQRFKDSEFKDSGFKDSGFRIQDSRIQDSGFKDAGFKDAGFRIQGCRIQDSEPRFTDCPDAFSGGWSHRSHLPHASRGFGDSGCTMQGWIAKGKICASRCRLDSRGRMKALRYTT